MCARRSYMNIRKYFVGCYRPCDHCSSWWRCTRHGWCGQLSFLNVFNLIEFLLTSIVLVHLALFGNVYFLVKCRPLLCVLKHEFRHSVKHPFRPSSPSTYLSTSISLPSSSLQPIYSISTTPFVSKLFSNCVEDVLLEAYLPYLRKKPHEAVVSSSDFQQTMFNQYKIACVVPDKWSKVRGNWQSSSIFFNFELGELWQPPFLMVSGSRDRNFTDEDRSALYAYILSKSVNSKLQYGWVKAAVEEFNVYCRTVTRNWNRQ